jgi:transposase-like protein
MGTREHDRRREKDAHARMDTAVDTDGDLGEVQVVAHTAGPSGGRALVAVERPGDREGNPNAEPLAVRQERAFALLCQGWRVAAIARALGVSPSTVRRWLRKRVDDLSQDAREAHATALLRAIESQREIARAAWEAYENERAVEAALLRGEFDRVRRRAVRRLPSGRDHSGNADDGGKEDAGEQVLLEEYERPRHASQGARYLGIALAAQREMARLHGLYEDIAPDPGEIKITISRRPDGLENLLPGQRLETVGLVADGGDGSDDEAEEPRED